MNDIALALCGGGGKGAFQIGVMKALEDMKLLKNVKAVAGTSVGALNAVLFALGNYETAKKIWMSIDHSVILPGAKFKKAGIFSPEGLQGIIESVPLEKLRRSKFKVYATVQPKDTRYAPEYICLNELSKTETIEVLLASSAMPVAYPPQPFRGRVYIDGGYREFGNTPVEPLYKDGFREIYVVALNSDFDIHSIKGIDGKIDYTARYPDCKLTVIKPDKRQGGVKGTLDFSQSGILNRMNLGCINALDILNNNVPGNIPKNGKINSYKNFEINALIKDMVDKTLVTGADWERFVTLLNCKGNKPMKTMGGKVWYANIAEVDGWRLQMHTVMGLMESHLRILDPNNVRRAWFAQPATLLDALKRFESVNKNII